MDTEPTPNTWPPSPTVPPLLQVTPKPHLLTGNAKWDGWTGTVGAYLLFYIDIELKRLWTQGIVGPMWILHLCSRLHLPMPIGLLVNVSLVLSVPALLGLYLCLRASVPVLGKAFGEGLFAAAGIWLAITVLTRIFG